MSRTTVVVSNISCRWDVREDELLEVVAAGGVHVEVVERRRA